MSHWGRGPLRFGWPPGAAAVLGQHLGRRDDARDAESADLDETARVIDRWVASSCSTADLAASFGCIVIEEVAPFYERGEIATFRWQQFLNEVPVPEMRPFVEAASRRVQLRQLVPYTSLAHFRFHRCAEPVLSTRYAVHVVPVRGDRFEVRGASGCVPGHGNAEEAADLVIANLRLAVASGARNCRLHGRSLTEQGPTGRTAGFRAA